MTDPNAIASFAELADLFERDGVLHQTDRAAQTVSVPTEQGPLDSVMLIRWQEGDGIVQFIQQIPLPVLDANMTDLAEAVARLNHALAIPGLDLNYEFKILAYRLYLPIHPRGYVTPADIQSMFGVTIKTAADLLPVLSAVIAGRLAPADVVSAAQQPTEPS